jgi:hypothetical protein
LLKNKEWKKVLKREHKNAANGVEMEVTNLPLVSFSIVGNPRFGNDNKGCKSQEIISNISQAPTFVKNLILGEENFLII